MLTHEQEKLIDATAPVVAEHLNAITQRFYPLMFTRYPEVKPLFNEVHQQSGGSPVPLPMLYWPMSNYAVIQLRRVLRWMLWSVNTSH